MSELLTVISASLVATLLGILLKREVQLQIAWKTLVRRAREQYVTMQNSPDSYSELVRYNSAYGMSRRIVERFLPAWWEVLPEWARTVPRLHRWQRELEHSDEVWDIKELISRRYCNPQWIRSQSNSLEEEYFERHPI